MDSILFSLQDPMGHYVNQNRLSDQHCQPWGGSAGGLGGGDLIQLKPLLAVNSLGPGKACLQAFRSSVWGLAWNFLLASVCVGSHITLLSVLPLHCTREVR